jgi:hypothetical protein
MLIQPGFAHQPIPAQLAHLHWSSGHDFRLSRVKSRQARETRVRFPDGEHPILFCLNACLWLICMGYLLLNKGIVEVL